jgi:hypothetical protein
MKSYFLFLNVETMVRNNKNNIVGILLVKLFIILTKLILIAQLWAKSFSHLLNEPYRYNLEESMPLYDALRSLKP